MRANLITVKYKTIFNNFWCKTRGRLTCTHLYRMILVNKSIQLYRNDNKNLHIWMHFPERNDCWNSTSVDLFKSLLLNTYLNLTCMPSDIASIGRISVWRRISTFWWQNIGASSFFLLQLSCTLKYCMGTLSCYTYEASQNCLETKIKYSVSFIYLTD